MAGAERAFFLIVDRGPAHIAKKTRAFVDSQHGRLRLFFCRPFAHRNPDELVWKHLKADTVGRMTITGKADFKAKVRASMRQLQTDPEKIRSFYQKPSQREGRPTRRKPGFKSFRWLGKARSDPCRGASNLTGCSKVRTTEASKFKARVKRIASIGSAEPLRTRRRPMSTSLLWNLSMFELPGS